MTKRDKVLQFLKAGKLLTKIKALKKFSLINLGDVIHILRSRGYQIETVMVKSPKDETYAIYRMKPAEQQRLMGVK